MTNLIASKLGVSLGEAYNIKSKQGIGYSDNLRDIVPIVKPLLDGLVHEVQKVIRYYGDRTSHQHKIAQVITFGGGANMRGFNEYLAKELGLPTRLLDPWRQLDFGTLRQPDELSKPMFITVAGEAILNSEEVFA